MKICSQYRLSTRYEITGSPYKEKVKLWQYTKYGLKRKSVYSLCKFKEILNLANLVRPSAGNKRVYSIAIYQNHACTYPWSSQKVLLANGPSGNQWGQMRTTSAGPLFASSLTELIMLVGSFSSFWNQGLILPRNSNCFFCSLLHWASFLTHLRASGPAETLV